MRGGRANMQQSATLARNIGEFRKMLGLNTERFAERCKVPEGRIIEIENDVHPLSNGLEIFRITSACNVMYCTAFERRDGEYTKFNAQFPSCVWDYIYRRLKQKYGKLVDIAKALSVDPSLPSGWLRGKSVPGPFALSNIIEVLQLTPAMLEEIVAKDEAKQRQKQEEKQKEETQKIEFVAKIVPSDPEPVKKTDAFEDRVIAIMRLQAKLPILVTRMEAIMSEMYELRSEFIALTTEKRGE